MPGPNLRLHQSLVQQHPVKEQHLNAEAKSCRIKALHLHDHKDILHVNSEIDLHIDSCVTDHFTSNYFKGKEFKGVLQ